MAVVKDQYAVPEPLVSPKVKDLLGESPLGRLGLRVGRKIVSLLRRSRDPVERKLWTARFLLPVRNVLLFHRPITTTLDGIAVLLAPQGATAGDVWTGAPGQTRGVAFLLSILEPGMTVFDVGAGAGLFAIAAAKKVGQQRVFAFEQDPAKLQLLKRNVALNHVGGVHALAQGLGDFIDARGANASRADVMKVDAGGAELPVLREAAPVLWQADAPLVVYEGLAHLTRSFGYHPVEILWFLESCGYELFTLDDSLNRMSRLGTDHQYDSMVVAAKPSHPAHEKLRARMA